MVKLASAREFRMYGPRLSRNRAEYMNAGLYVFATAVLLGGFVAQLSNEPKSGLVLMLIALALILVVNLHDLVAHLAMFDYRMPLMEFDLQLALVEFAVPVVQALGTVLSFLGILFLLIQAEKGYGYSKLERHAKNMLIAGPVLWLLGSIHNSCQIYERADGHVQILQQSVHIPFLIGSVLFTVGAVLNSREQHGLFLHGLQLLGRNWVWLGMGGSLFFLIGGLANVVKVFKMQQMGDGLRLEKLRGGAQERLVHEREGQVPLILEDQRRRSSVRHDDEHHLHHVEPNPNVAAEPAPTPYKDVLVGDGLVYRMASVSSQPQFRYTQPPSKVLHLRNLPWECTEEELIELGKPFGKVVNTKCNVGANRNQAFIEFADLNQAIAMISYYASSSEPAQVRGKTVYLQYSNRQEIVNNKTAADVAGNVLLVTIEGADARLVSIDILHLVFSAFGFVHKITTFEKTAGFQALVQFSDAETATSAKTALDSRIIPRYLLPEYVGPCTLRITYSGHTDLSVKFQSHRSRDYTNPTLPVAPSAIDGSGQPIVGLDGKKLESESNVLLASIENMQYAVTLDVLHMVFSAFGPIQKIAMFDKNGGVQALIQYPDVQTAVVAKEALEGHCIYDGGFCKLHISYSRHTDLSIKVNNDRSRDYTIPTIPIVTAQPSILGQQPVHQMSPAVPPYNGAQYATTDQAVMPQPSAGWGPTVPAVPPSMPIQMHNQPYMPPGTMPVSSPQMGPVMMQSGPPPPPYHRGHVQ
ncbi:polypyrimidine tract-binding protein-like protein 2 [Pyrus ussuriensis x Pyrus communis]|uniref:Polypyrimidine tract-binding protein-like protein 2 n=1 Tax=Pyrus ussuriensis x Pyrus communis TaxID=2448454 RepID=A0A5N5F192_9ROSA|nr:polypyrimidine tract-binding protein-like protein 2 [Pyrus ussuriensis x Pyrus communis]